MLAKSMATNMIIRKLSIKMRKQKFVLFVLYTEDFGKRQMGI